MISFQTSALDGRNLTRRVGFHSVPRSVYRDNIDKPVYSLRYYFCRVAVGLADQQAKVAGAMAVAGNWQQSLHCVESSDIRGEAALLQGGGIFSP